MVRKRISSSSNPLVRLEILIPQSQKDFLDSLGESASAFIRKLISAQMDGYYVELSKLNEEEGELEARLNIVKAQISELEAETKKKQLAGQDREKLLDNQVTGLYLSSVNKYKGKPESLDISQIEHAIKFRTEAINQKLNGTGAEPIKIEEFIQLLLSKAKAEGVEVYGL